VAEIPDIPKTEDHFLEKVRSDHQLRRKESSLNLSNMPVVD